MTTLAQRLRSRRIARAKSALAARKRAAGGGDRGFWLSDRVRDAIMGAQLRHPYREHPWVYRAVSVIARDIAATPFTLYAGEDDEPDEVIGGPWYDLFTRPNPELTRSRIWELTATHLLLPPGECFWILHDATGPIQDDRSIPTYVWPHSGKAWKEEIGRDGLIEAWIHQTPTGKHTYAPHQVAHFTLPDPENPRRGQSPLEAAMRSVRTDHKAHLWNEGLLDNGADPGVVLKMPALETAEQVAQVRRQWNDRHQGPSKGGRLAVLTGEKDDVIRTSFSHRDMDYMGQREWSRQEVAAAYGVPLFLLTVLGDVHRETSRESLKLYWENAVIPIMRVLQDTLEAQLFMGRSDAASRAKMSTVTTWGAFDTSGVKALQTEERERRELAKQDRDLGWSRNAVNARHDLMYDPDDGLGDVALVPAMLERLEDVEAEPGPVPAAFGGPPDGTFSDPAEQDDEDDEDDAAPEDDDTDTGEEGDRGAILRAVVWKTYIRDIHGPGERRFKGRLSRYFYARRAEILAWLNDPDNQMRAEPIISAGAFDSWIQAQTDRWDDLLIEQTEPIHRSIMASSLDRLGQQLGGLKQANMEHPSVLRVLADRQQQIKTVNQTLQVAVRKVVAEGTGEGIGIKGIAKNVRALMTDASRHGAERIARTETGAASTGARFAGYEVEGVEEHTWITAADEKVRDSHQIDGETVPVNGTFSNGLRYPLEAGAPAEEVINCRCDTIPVVRET